MLDLDNSYLISKLNQGSNLKIIFLSHNAYWPYIDQLDDFYENCSVQVYGRGVSYIEMALMAGNQIPMDDCDLIIYYSSDYYDEYEFMKLKDMALKISSDKGKKVSIGYSYHIQGSQRNYEDLEYGVEIIGIKDEAQVDYKNTVISGFTPLELTELTLLSHDDLERQYTRIRI